MAEGVFIRAEALDVNLSGQRLVHLLASNADGIYFWTDAKSLVPAVEIVAKKNAETASMDERKTWVTDFQRCVGEASLKAVLTGMDRLGYHLISVSQNGDTYTVFFKRPVNG